MSTGPETTFTFLSTTKNRAAVDVLVAGLDAADRATRGRALTALMNRFDSEGHREVFSRLATFDEESRQIIRQRSERLAGVVNATLKDAKVKNCAAACDAILAFRLYDAIPGLIAAMPEEHNPNTRLAAKTVLKLIQLLYKELGASESDLGGPDLEAIRRRATTALEDGVRKFSRHRQTEVVEAFLLVAKRQDAMLRRILSSPTDPSHEPMTATLVASPRGGVVRLLLGFLDDPQMPLAIARAIGSRCDRKFVDHLLHKASSKSSRSKLFADALTRFDSIAWAKPGHELLVGLDDDGQDAAVRFLMGTSVPKTERLDTIEYLLAEGKPGGRRAAAAALAEFEGPRADRLAVLALNDADVEVRAHVVRQLRPRNIPGAMSLLLRMVDSPHQEIRDALRDAMPEFGLRQFLAIFDTLSDQLQLLGGHLVQRIDPNATSLLAAEMTSLSPIRRRRAVNVVKAMAVVGEMEESLVALMSDDDHRVRIAAAEALAEGATLVTWEALRDAMLDRSVIVQEAAEQSLLNISQTLRAEARREKSEMPIGSDTKGSPRAEGKEMVR